jgi:hypothetical protein
MSKSMTKKENIQQTIVNLILAYVEEKKHINCKCKCKHASDYLLYKKKTDYNLKKLKCIDTALLQVALVENYMKYKVLIYKFKLVKDAAMHVFSQKPNDKLKAKYNDFYEEMILVSEYINTYLLPTFCKIKLSNPEITIEDEAINDKNNIDNMSLDKLKETLEQCYPIYYKYALEDKVFFDQDDVLDIYSKIKYIETLIIKKNAEEIQELD